MTKHEFIFSNKTSHKVARHLLFWLVYCTYFYLQSLPPRTYVEFFKEKTYYIALINLCCFAPVFITTTYVFIFYLLPKTIKKKKYSLFIICFLLVYITGTFINYFTAEMFLYYTGFFPNTFQHRVEMGNYNMRWGMIIATIAIGIKLSKDWYLQQKENLEILREKTRSEMQIQKARIHPEFLLRSLDAIYTHAQSGSDKSLSMILNLSDLLSYSLYESDMKLVPIEKELLEIKHLIALEQQNEESLITIEMHVDGETNNQYIAPMLIVKLLQENIALLRNAKPEPYMVSLNIIVTNNRLFLDLSIIGPCKKTLPQIKWLLLIGNIGKSLNEYYSKNDYQIELGEEENETLISLNLRLSKGVTSDSSIKLIPTSYDLV